MMLQKVSPPEWRHRKIGTLNIFYNRKTGIISYIPPLRENSDNIIEIPYTPDAPLRVYLDPTYYCNLSCRHCMTNSSSSTNTLNQIPKERFFSILTELARIGVLEVAITGGEPLCYPGIVPLVNHATRSGLNCILTTNGTLINENIAQQLAKAGLFEIKVSFEGGRERNDSIRGIGVYDRAMQGLNALTEHGINTSVRLTLHNGSEVGLDELFSDMVGANVTRVKITVVKPIGRAALPENNDLLGFDISQEAYNHINDLGSRYGISMHFSSDDFPFRPELLNDDKPRCQKYNNCGAGFETAYISPTGDVLPCSSMPEIILGNISEVDFITIWNGERSRRFRKFAQRCNVQRLCTCTGIRNFLN